MSKYMKIYFICQHLWNIVSYIKMYETKCFRHQVIWTIVIYLNNMWKTSFI